MGRWGGVSASLVIGSYVNVGDVSGEVVGVERFEEDDSICGFVVECGGKLVHFNLDALFEEMAAAEHGAVN